MRPGAGGKRVWNGRPHPTDMSPHRHPAFRECPPVEPVAGDRGAAGRAGRGEAGTCTGGCWCCASSTFEGSPPTHTHRHHWRAPPGPHPQTQSSQVVGGASTQETASTNAAARLQDGRRGSRAGIRRPRTATDERAAPRTGPSPPPRLTACNAPTPASIRTHAIARMMTEIHANRIGGAFTAITARFELRDGPGRAQELGQATGVLKAPHFV